MLQILQLRALVDNYVYVLQDTESQQVAVVDPTSSQLVLRVLEERGWQLNYVLNTHHHWDHVGGNLELKEATGCQIVGAMVDSRRIPGIDITLRDGDIFRLGQSQAEILETPGHTTGHICYWFAESTALFCGDTLFSLGCGRLFEGTPAQMWNSLKRFRELPDATRVFCAHEYTQANGDFAVTIEPDNPELATYRREITKLRSQDLPTIPSTIAREKACNPFLRADEPTIRSQLKMPHDDVEIVFAQIRARKDRF